MLGNILFLILIFLSLQLVFQLDLILDLRICVDNESDQDVKDGEIGCHYKRDKEKED